MFRAFFLFLFLGGFTTFVGAQTPAREFARAEAAWDKDDYAAAEKYFDSALNLSAESSADEAHAYFGRGLARLQLHKWQGARDDLNASIELNPDNAEAFASRGMARKNMGDYTGLLEDAHRAALIDPEYQGFEDDARSTVLWKRSLLGFMVLGCIVVAIGLVPFVRAVTRATRGERDARARTKSDSL